jgi:hypothetical protein
VGPIKGNEDAKLIRLNVEVLRWNTLVTWNIRAAEELPGHAVAEQLID